MFSNGIFPIKASKGPMCVVKGKFLPNDKMRWCTVVKCWTIDPEVRGLIPGLARTFLRQFMFPTQVEVQTGLKPRGSFACIGALKNKWGVFSKDS